MSLEAHGELAPILWRRLDVPGHDTASLRARSGGFALSGMAVFGEGTPTALAYTVHCDGALRPSEGQVHGWRGMEGVDVHLRRHAGDRWTLNRFPCPAVDGCADLDLSFTPATNLLALRRLALGPGKSAEVRSAWLEWPALRLTPLVQRYACRSPTEYGYEADLPDGTVFRAVLRIQPGGWVLDYAGLWRAETPA